MAVLRKTYSTIFHKVRGKVTRGQRKKPLDLMVSFVVHVSRYVMARIRVKVWGKGRGRGGGKRYRTTMGGAAGRWFNSNIILRDLGGGMRSTGCRSDGYLFR